MKRVIKNAMLIFVLLITFGLSAQNIIKIDKNKMSDKSIASKVNVLKASTDITYLKSNGEVKYGSSNSKTIQFNYNQINFLNNINSSYQSDIEFAIIQISSDFNSTIYLNSLSQLTALNFIYLLVEKNVSDTALVNSINANNPNWTIAYEFSLPE